MRTFGAHLLAAILLTYGVFRIVGVSVAFTTSNALVVFLFFFILLWLSALLYHKAYVRKLPQAISFFLFFLKEMVIANLRITLDILSPRFHMKPCVVALPLAVQSNLEITLFSVIMSLTPGTLCLDLDGARRIMYIHALYLNEGGMEELKRSIKNSFELPLIRLMR